MPPTDDTLTEAPVASPARDTSARWRHELRTPLNQIIGYCELLAEEAGDGGEASRLVPDLERVTLAAKHLNSLLNAHFDGTPSSAPPQPEAAPATRALSPAPHLPSPTSAHLLVVDDVAANRDLLARRLKHEGYQVDAASCGEDALERLRQEAFDVVLLDVLMPGMDGVQVLSAIRDDPALRHVPVIMLSALDELDNVVRCIELGAEDYLPKPFNPVLLRARLSACLEKKRLRDREVELFEQLRDNYERLSSLERWRDDWTQMIVHDLRTPLTSIMGGLQTLEIAGSVTELQREFITIAVRGAENLLGIITDLLDVAKLEAGQMKLDDNLIAPGDLVRGAVGAVQGLVQDKELPLNVAIEADLPTFHGDMDKLRRVLVNLLGNALKFTPRGGHIDIEVKRQSPDGALLFAVRDTGEGVPPESVPLIFDKFGQVEARRGGRKLSTGLGLTFCKLVVEAHGGRIWVESEPEQGSTFFFSLPSQHGG